MVPSDKRPCERRGPPACVDTAKLAPAAGTGPTRTRPCWLPDTPGRQDPTCCSEAPSVAPNFATCPSAQGRRWSHLEAGDPDLADTAAFESGRRGPVTGRDSAAVGLRRPSTCAVSLKAGADRDGHPPFRENLPLTQYKTTVPGPPASCGGAGPEHSVTHIPTRLGLSDTRGAHPGQTGSVAGSSSFPRLAASQLLTRLRQRRRRRGRRAATLDRRSQPTHTDETTQKAFLQKPILRLARYQVASSRLSCQLRRGFTSDEETEGLGGGMVSDGADSPG